MTAAQSPQPTSSDGPTRRGFLERVGVGTGAVVTLGVGGSAVAPQFSPVGRAQGIACGGLCIGAAAAGGGVALGWALGEWDPLEDDSPPEGTTWETLIEDVYDTALTRESENASTFIDNQNILDGAEHTAYGDGKVAGIESLNNQDAQTDVTQAAQDANAEYWTTIITNLLESWNESVRELRNYFGRLNGHVDSPSGNFEGDLAILAADGYSSSVSRVVEGTMEYELPDGSTFEVEDLIFERDNDAGGGWNLIDVDRYADDRFGSDPVVTVSLSTRSDDVTYLSFSEWNGLFQSMIDSYNTVNDGLATWVDGVYGEIQSGELDTEDLLTPRELAEMSADEEGINQAIADLMALNIPVDLEREATISVESENETATLSGMLAPTTPPADGIQSGETYDPSTMEGDIYFNYDISQGSAIWTAYDSAGVDGGTVTFTSEPYGGTLFRINTTAGEQATVSSGDFTLDDGGTPDDDTDDVWTVDISDQVETAITEIDEVEMVAESGDTKYQMIILDQPFTVEKIEDSDGNEADSMEFSNSEPQDDSNYITEEEWQEMQERNQELIDKFEQSQNDGGSIVDALDPEALAQDYGGAVAGLVIIFVTLSTVVGYVTGNIPGMGD